MNRSEVLFLGIGGAIALLFYSKARAAGTLIFMPGGVSDIGYDGVTPIITLNLIAQNTSSAGFTLESLAANLTSGEYYIGNVSSFFPVQVPGNSQAVIPVKVRLMLIGIVQEIITSIHHNDFTKKIRLNGFANAGFVRVPIDVQFTVGGNG